MHEQHAVDGAVAQRQVELVDQRGQGRPGRGPFHHPLRRRHEGEAAFRLFAKEPEIGSRIADAEHLHAAGVGEPGANATSDEAPGDHAKALGIEIAQIDDVVGHGTKIA